MAGGTSDTTSVSGAASVVKVGAKKCKPFLLQVMVFSPEAGFKFEVMVERACTPENEPIWKLVFDLFKRKADGSDFDQIVHISFRAGSEQETAGIKQIAADGVSSTQSDLLVGDVFDGAKELEGVGNPTPAQKQKIRKAMSRVATADVEV